jgi:hypothetical protein
MNKSIQTSFFFISLLPLLSACTTAKIEARLEANPQCKDVYNAKTGALMPCPGTDRSFYVAAGLEAPRQAKQAISPTTITSPASNAPAALSVGTVTQAAQAQPIQSSTAAQEGCKPMIHKKTGGMLPCPPID